MSLDQHDDTPAWDENEGEEELAEGEWPGEAKRALAMLLRQRFITRAKAPVVWAVIDRYRTEIATHLSNMYLELIMDDVHGVVCKRQSREEDASVILRAETIGRDASFLLIHLRKEYAIQDGTDEAVVVSRDQIEEHLRPFLSDTVQNEERFASRVESAINGVDRLGLLAQRRDVDYLYEVSPAIVPLIGDEEFMLLEQAYRMELGSVAGIASASTPQDIGLADSEDDGQPEQTEAVA